MLNLFINYTGNEGYQIALSKWADQIGERVLDTVYLSCLETGSVKHVSSLLDEVKTHFKVTEKTEVTVETNPQDLSLLFMRSLYGDGVNRLSLARANCDHLVDGFSFFDSVNVYGRLFEGSQHISRYDLKDFEQFDHVRLALASHGLAPYDRYHFCQLGHACRYLVNILHYQEYLGIGEGAHSRLTFDGQLYAIKEEESFESEKKPLSDQEHLEEFLLQNLSLYHGLNLAYFEKIFDQPLADFFDPQQWQDWISQTVLYKEDGHIRLVGEHFMSPEKIVSKLSV